VRCPVSCEHVVVSSTGRSTFTDTSVDQKTTLQTGTRFLARRMSVDVLLWPPCVAIVDIIFLHCDFYLSSIFFPHLISAVADWMSTIGPTSTHDVALVRI